MVGTGGPDLGRRSAACAWLLSPAFPAAGSNSNFGGYRYLTAGDGLLALGADTPAGLQPRSGLPSLTRAGAAWR